MWVVVGRWGVGTSSPCHGSYPDQGSYQGSYQVCSYQAHAIRVAIGVAIGVAIRVAIRVAATRHSYQGSYQGSNQGGYQGGYLTSSPALPLSSTTISSISIPSSAAVVRAEWERARGEELRLRGLVPVLRARGEELRLRGLVPVLRACNCCLRCGSEIRGGPLPWVLWLRDLRRPLARGGPLPWHSNAHSS